MKNSNLSVFILTFGGLWLALESINALIILGGVLILIAFAIAVVNDVKEIKEEKNKEVENGNL